MAHFLEHLVFKGGEKYAHYRDVNETAERMGGMLNAYTSHDLVAFHITVRAEAALRGDRPAHRLRRPPAARRRRARPRARRRHPGDPALQGPAVGGGRGADRPRRVRRAPAGAHACSAPRSTCARSPATRSSPSASAAGPARAAARSSSATSTTCPTNGAVGELFERFPDPRPSPRPSSRRRRSRPRSLVEERDTNQSHLRMIYRPQIDVADPAAARGADDLLDAAGRLDGLAPVRRDPRAARPLLLGLRRSTTCCADVPVLQLGAGLDSTKCVEAYTRMREIVAELRDDGPTEEEVERARAYAAGRRVLAFENTERGGAPRRLGDDRPRRADRPRRRDRRAWTR